MADLQTLIRGLIDDGSLALIRDNPLAQFGPRNRPYLGATLLPERIVSQNIYREMSIQYRTVIANDGERYSPAQIKSSGQLVGEFLVELGNQDIALEMDANTYDAILMALAGGNPNMQSAANNIVRLADSAVAALAMLNEKQRWQAIVDSAVVREGDNGFGQTIAYVNPANHRAAAGDAWTDDSYDPYEDILERQSLLADKGYTLRRIITSTRVMNILARNEQMSRRFAPARVLSDATYFGTLDRSGIDAGFRANGLPVIETYDALWRDQTSSGRMLSDSVMVFIAATDEEADAEIANGDTYLPNLTDLIGYHAIGRPVGQPTSGRVLRLFAREDKPPTVMAEAWQTALPVITHPEAIATITGIA